MDAGYLGNAGIFLVRVLFGLYILAVLLRLLLQLVRAEFYNPFSQFIVKITNPLLVPLRRVIPGLGGVDVASIVLLISLQMLEIALIGLMAGFDFNLPGLLVLATGELLGLLINVFFYAILIQAILSWVSPGSYNPMTSLLYSLNAPILRPAQRLIPPVSGIDLSPLVVLIALQLLHMLLVVPVVQVGQQLLLH